MEVQSVGSQFTFDNLITPKEEFTIFIEGRVMGCVLLRRCAYLHSDCKQIDK